MKTTVLCEVELHPPIDDGFVDEMEGRMVVKIPALDLFMAYKIKSYADMEKRIKKAQEVHY